jgi:hypothetical protein
VYFYKPASSKRLTSSAAERIRLGPSGAFNAASMSVIQNGGRSHGYKIESVGPEKAANSATSLDGFVGEHVVDLLTLWRDPACARFSG